MAKKRKRKGSASKEFRYSGPRKPVQRELLAEKRAWDKIQAAYSGVKRKDQRVVVSVRREKHGRKHRFRPFDPNLILRTQIRAPLLEVEASRKEDHGVNRKEKMLLLGRAAIAHRMMGQRTPQGAAKLRQRRNRALQEWRAIVCSEREVRREIMHAKGKAGGKVAKPRKMSELNRGQQLERQVKC